MPKGIYVKNFLHRSTNKLKTGMTILKAHEPGYQMQDITTNEDVYIKLKELGFRYVDGMWYKPRNLNGHAQMPLAEPKPETIIKPIHYGHLEMTVSDDQLDTVQGVIEAMHTLGYVVEVHIRGVKSS